MKIVDYDQVDPLQVMYTTRLALDFTLSPEHAAYIRRSDPRPFPFLSVCAVEDDIVVGHVGVFRLPLVSTVGREDVGGIWAVSTHPQYSGRGVATALIEEAHARMRAAGLRFSTLGTDRSRTAHALYRRLGYVETNVWAAALASWETAHQPTRLRADAAESYESVEQIFAEIAPAYLGFAWRHTPFERLRRVALSDIWILRANNRLAGYALTELHPGLLKVTSLALHPEADAAEAVAALAAVVRSAHVQVKISRPCEIAALRQAGYHVAHPTWSAFMVKPLAADVTYADAQRLFAIGSDKFMISWLDVT